MLEIRDLHVSYGPVPVLTGIDFTVGDGEIVAFIGPNGAGKTTTLNAVAGLVPRTGDVLLDGEPLPPAAEAVVLRTRWPSSAGGSPSSPRAGESSPP